MHTVPSHQCIHKHIIKHKSMVECKHVVSLQYNSILHIWNDITVDMFHLLLRHLILVYFGVETYEFTSMESLFMKPMVPPKSKDRLEDKTLEREMELAEAQKSPKLVHFPPGNPTYPLKTDGWKMHFLLKSSLFRGHVSFPGCIPWKVNVESMMFPTSRLVGYGSCWEGGPLEWKFVHFPEII